MKSEAVGLFKENVLALGQMVSSTIAEMARMLRKEKDADMLLIDRQEKAINKLYQQVEEQCFELLLEKDSLTAKEIRTLVASTIIAGKFERMADHANRVAKIGSWAREEDLDIPEELAQMAEVIHRMIQDVLLSMLADAPEKAEEILSRDSQIDYLDAMLSKQLLSDLGDQGERAQMRAQFLFCTRFLERMGDLCTSIAKRSYFISTGKRLRSESTNIPPSHKTV